MSMSNITKLYAAFKAGYLGNNILDTYFSFVANIIYEEHLTVVEDTVVAAKLRERYKIDFPLPLIRQVLGVGVENNCFIEDHGKYSVSIEKLVPFCFRETDFNIMWNRLINEFTAYCREKNIELPSIDMSEAVLRILDNTDEKILAGEKIEDHKGISPMEFAWYSFTKEQGEKLTDLYSFIAAISASNITKQALFYSGEKDTDYSGLNVYLDSPIVFALLGMDEPSRTESYKTLVADMLKANCNVQVLDHNFQEVDGIIASASSWATSTQYDLRKANNAARFFHDSQMNEMEISEFCSSIEDQLNELGITVKETYYDIFQNEFQENADRLFDMIKTQYSNHGYELTQEKERTIQTDVRSIIMIYRERQGHTATRLQNAKHIMLTSNNSIANVSKKYESNQSIQYGHIPACISADLFGAILWLNSPTKMLEYQKQKLLADCYAFLKPDKVLLDKYIKSLEDARAADEIDEKKFLFLRTHKVVLDSLMDITKGDYARFNSKTYLEVYDDIQERSLKQYRDEVAAHEETREKLRKAEEDAANKSSKNELLNERITLMEKQEHERKEKEFNKKVKFWGWIVTALLVAIPYLLLMVAIEIVKTQFTDMTWRSAFGIAGTVIATAIAGTLFAIGKKKCFKLSERIIKKKILKEENNKMAK